MIRKLPLENSDIYDNWIYMTTKQAIEANIKSERKWDPF